MHEIATQSVISDLGLSHTANLDDSIYFTGWFNPSSSSPGVVGRIVKWLPKQNGKTRQCAYVCLPSFNSGILPEGSFIDHGDERLTEVCSMEDMRRMFVTGLEKLKEIIANEGHSGN